MYSFYEKKQSFYPKFIPFVKIIVKYPKPLKYSYYKLISNNSHKDILLPDMPLEAPQYIKRNLPPEPLEKTPVCLMDNKLLEKPSVCPINNILSDLTCPINNILSDLTCTINNTLSEYQTNIYNNINLDIAPPPGLEIMSLNKQIPDNYIKTPPGLELINPCKDKDINIKIITKSNKKKQKINNKQDNLIKLPSGLETKSQKKLLFFQ